MKTFGMLWLATVVGSPVMPSEFTKWLVPQVATVSPLSTPQIDIPGRRPGKPPDPALVSLNTWTEDVGHQVRTWLPVVQVTTEPSKTPSAVQMASSPDPKAAARCSNEIQALQSISESDEGYHVEVRGTSIAILPSQALAERLAKQLKPVLDREDFALEPIYPALVDRRPGAKMGDRPLFTVDKATARALRRSADLIAVQWTNSLRHALELEPLSLTEAQEHLYGLVSTQRRLKGVASWYGPYFHGRTTAAGETFDQKELTAAHPNLPFGTYLRVTNLISGSAVVVRINDRGPYVGRRSLDLSRAAARCIGSERRGVVPYQAVILTKGEAAQLKPKTNLIARAQRSDAP